ncbi:MAG: AAA family ATPase [Christensenellales bacterium]|jgi:RecA-family ATPase
MSNNILEALNHINVAELTYDEWLSVGMALKNENYDCSVWDDWSRNDERYKAGECQRKWSTFGGSSNPITGATIVQMAQNRGFVARTFEGDGCIGWDDAIEYDGIGSTYEIEETLTPAEQLITYLETLFEPDELVGYVTNEVWQDSNNKWMPAKGVWDRTAKELITAIKKHTNDLGAVIGDWKEECGAWIRFNPLDGGGVKNENVTRFAHALVESDDMQIAEQDALYRRLELPIATLTYSGGKSLHAIVRVDAENYDEYRKRVDFLYEFLEKNGLKVDRQNRNPSRLSRMPGVTRNGQMQTLVATNIGRKSYVDWLDFVEGATDELPSFTQLSDVIENPPKLPDELISGVLRCGHKMLISGSSKAGKSFLLMELAIALSEGLDWLGLKCRKSRVLYVNLEIDAPSCINRFIEIYKALKLKPKHATNIVLWNLRGHAVPLDKLVPKLLRRMANQHFDAIVIDPIYKVITGDENNASEMGAFCNQFDRICNETGCATIYCHHHSKGAQGQKKAMYRASGSGVFARDPDAQLDMIQLETDLDFLTSYADNLTDTAWRLECSLREFPNFKPRNFWFKYPIHIVDDKGTLDSLYSEGDPKSNLTASGKRKQTPESRKNDFDTAFDVCVEDGCCTVEALAEYLDLSVRTIQKRVNEFKDDYLISKGIVYRR